MDIGSQLRLEPIVGYQDNSLRNDCQKDIRHCTPTKTPNCMIARAHIAVLFVLRIFKSITMTSLWARLRLKSPASRLFTQSYIQAQIKENIKAPRHRPFFRGIHQLPMNSPHKGPVTRKKIPFDDVIMRPDI